MIKLDFKPDKAFGVWFSDSERIAIASPYRFDIYNVISGLRLCSVQTETVNRNPKLVAED